MLTVDSGENENVSPRFEFRTFGHELGSIVETMSRLTDEVPERVRERTSDEIYIVSRYSDVNNTKIRYGLMDIKTLIRTIDGLEQWSPLMKAEFPIDANILNGTIFRALGIDAREESQNTCSLDDFLRIIDSYEALRAVNVSKHRYGYSVNGTICETANVSIDGIEVVTVSTESTDIEAVKKTITDLGLAGLENINYLQAIKRTLGMSDKPLAN